MANNYFQFKEFIVYHDKCSMKVCTDSCILGAWIAEKVSLCKLPIANCLDIGAGTGLLSLMFAQKNTDTLIDAVEIENEAYEQAKENFKNSKWNYRLNIFHSNIKNFLPGKKYDLIISNPPFFENDLLSNDKNKNIAKHDEGISYSALVGIIKKHLSKSGYFALLLPYFRINYFKELAEGHGFFLDEELFIRQTPSHDFFRGILFFGLTKTTVKCNELTIKNNLNYTKEFSALLKDYYLQL